MTAVLSPSSSPSTSTHRTQSPSASGNLSALPPLITNPSTKRTNPQRPPSYAKNRMSSYSTASNASQNRSRPPSHVFPVFHSSLAYATVRDFAYPTLHPLHYGPPAEPSGPISGLSTPVSEQRRLSDPVPTWDSSGGQWSAGPWGGDGFFGTHQLPQMAYGDGPPYSEDEDLHSPVVVSSKHKKSKSAWGHFGNGRGRGRSPARGRPQGESDVTSSANYEGDRGFFTGTNGDGSETYYINNADDLANGPGGELVTYPPDQTRHSTLAPNTYNVPGQRDSHFAATLPNRSYRQRDTPERPDHNDAEDDSDDDDDDSEVDYRENQSRYSRDYQFTIASPDEEMHGKAVALFDFARENENELPLVEGQVIWVSYRHGQGWLVAEDPKTGESGLVPEEYVRLLRHIEGGWTSLNGELANSTEGGFLSPMSAAPDSAVTPTQADPQRQNIIGGHSSHSSNGSNVSGEKHPPMVSTFSTSSKDLHLYPQHLLGTQAGQTPPHVMHYDGKKHGSQMSTPTLANPSGGFRRESDDSGSSRKNSITEAGNGEDDGTR